MTGSAEVNCRNQAITLIENCVPVPVLFPCR